MPFGRRTIVNQPDAPADLTTSVGPRGGFLAGITSNGSARSLRLGVADVIRAGEVSLPYHHWDTIIREVLPRVIVSGTM